VYCEPAILGEIQPGPPWLRNWDLFKAELEFNFGPFNNAAQAEIELEKIVMKEHHKAARYFIDFTTASLPELGGMMLRSDMQPTKV
jgi:hypothetical protein